MKYMRITAGYTWTDHKTNKQIAKELKITTILDKLVEYKRNWIQHVNRMPRNRLPRVMKHYSPTGRRNHGRPLKRFLKTWDRNGSTSGPTPWQIYDDDDDDDDLLAYEAYCTRHYTLIYEVFIRLHEKCVILPGLFFLLKTICIAVTKMEFFFSCQACWFNVDLHGNTQITYCVYSLVCVWVDFSFGVGIRMRVVERNVAKILSINRLKAKITWNSFEAQFVPHCKHTPSRLWKHVSCCYSLRSLFWAIVCFQAHSPESANWCCVIIFSFI